MPTFKSCLRSTSLLIALAVTTGCSSANTESTSDESADDIQASSSRKEAEDLFRPDESTLFADVGATMPGLKSWKLYATPKGLTIRGMSESGKIKVVYVVAYKAEEGGVRPKSVGFLNASDFVIHADQQLAMRQLTAAIQKDLGSTEAGGLAPKAEKNGVCATSKTRGLLIEVGMALAAGGGIFEGTSLCLAIAAPTCVGVIAVLLSAGLVSFMTGVGIDTCEAK